MLTEKLLELIEFDPNKTVNKLRLGECINIYFERS